MQDQRYRVDKLLVVFDHSQMERQTDTCTDDPKTDLHLAVNHQWRHNKSNSTQHYSFLGSVWYFGSTKRTKIIAARHVSWAQNMLWQPGLWIRPHWGILGGVFTYIRNVWTYYSETYHTYSLLGPRDTDDIW